MSIDSSQNNNKPPTLPAASTPKEKVNFKPNFQGVTALVDASYNKDKDEYSIGFILIKGDDEPVAAGSRRISNPGTVFGAELVAIREGIKKCNMLGIRQVRILFNSLEAVDAVLLKEGCFRPESLILNEVWKKMQQGLVKTINYIPGTQNTMAHDLAKLALHSLNPQDWSGVVIQFL